MFAPRWAPARKRKFIFVFAKGGWDPTLVLADGFDHTIVARERGAERARIGGLGFVDHPARPSVRRFFEANAERCVVIQGLCTRSIDHTACTRDSLAALESLGDRASVQVGVDGADWDTHTRNGELQSMLWEHLFADLTRRGSTLASDTVVVVLSELGRAPTLNTAGGKEHWPFTSALLFGDGLQGGRSIGGWDRSWYGRNEDGPPITFASLGATLAALADVEPASVASGSTPIAGVIA